MDQEDYFDAVGEDSDIEEEAMANFLETEGIGPEDYIVRDEPLSEEDQAEM